MNIPIASIRQRIAGARDRPRDRRWEELAAAGMDDRELALLNDYNTRDFEGAQWAGQWLIYGGGQRP